MNREKAKRERVVPMDPAIKKVAIVLACALIVVIGLIILTRGVAIKEAEVATVKSEVKVEAEIAKTEEEKAPTAHEPVDEATASQEDVTDEAQHIEQAQEEMYEGALAGLSEEEIAKLAMAEEHSAAREEMTEGVENAVD